MLLFSLYVLLRLCRKQIIMTIYITVGNTIVIMLVKAMLLQVLLFVILTI